MHLLGIGSGAATPTDLVVPVHPAAVVGSTKADALPAASDAALSPYASTCPKLTAGGRAVQVAAEINRENLMTMSGMQAGPRLITPMYSAYVKTVKLADEVQDAVVKGSTLNKPTIGSMCNAFFGSWLVCHTDLVTEDVKAMIVLDQQAPRHLFRFAVQWQTNWKLVERCFEEALTRATRDWALQCGERAKHFQREGALDRGGCVRRGMCGRYTLTFEGGRATKIIHCSGDAADVHPNVLVGKDFGITDNFCDYTAVATKHPTNKSLRLCTLFDVKHGIGPYKVPPVTNRRNIDFKKDVVKHAQTLAKLKAAATSTPTSEKTKVTIAAVEASADAQAARTKYAREKASEAFAKNADRAVHMG